MKYEFLNSQFAFYSTCKTDERRHRKECEEESVWIESDDEIHKSLITVVITLEMW